MSSLNLTISNPLKVLLQVTSHMVLLPTVDGEIGVLYDHIPMIVSLNFGLIKISTATNDIIEAFYIDGGVARIDGENLDIICNHMLSSTGLDVANLSAQMSLIDNLASMSDKKEFYDKIYLHLRQKNIK
jgi:F-type H+-transporting ATPase subunit epsilon